jgi:hypothetical protein
MSDQSLWNAIRGWGRRIWVLEDKVAKLERALSSEAQPIGAAGEAEAALQHRMSPNPPPPHPIGNGEAGGEP